jgi:hypothetical protein
MLTPYQDRKMKILLRQRKTKTKDERRTASIERTEEKS